MQIVKSIDLDIDIEQARARQLELSRAVQLVAGRVDVTTVAATYDKEAERAYAASVALDAPTTRVIDHVRWVGMPRFFYVLGLSSQREADEGSVAMGEEVSS